MKWLLGALCPWYKQIFQIVFRPLNMFWTLPECQKRKFIEKCENNDSTLPHTSPNAFSFRHSASGRVNRYIQYSWIFSELPPSPLLPHHFRNGQKCANQPNLTYVSFLQHCVLHQKILESHKSCLDTSSICCREYLVNWSTCEYDTAWTQQKWQVKALYCTCTYLHLGFLCCFSIMLCHRTAHLII